MKMFLISYNRADTNVLPFLDAQRETSSLQPLHASWPSYLYGWRISPHWYEDAGVRAYRESSRRSILALRKLSRMERGRSVRHHDQYDYRHRCRYLWRPQLLGALNHGTHSPKNRFHGKRLCCL